MVNVKKFLLFTCFALVLSAAAPVSASVSEGGDPWMRPQVGVWFGPVTPLFNLWDDLNTFLGGGAYVRLPLFDRGMLGFDTSYEYLPSNSLDRLQLIPMYGNFIFRLPINSPIIFQVKAGAGASWVSAQPMDRSQYDPLFMAGFELAFPAGNFANIGMRFDYLYLYESYHKGAKRDGQVLLSGLTLYFNLDIF
jgi:hypothetical protein